MYGQLISLSLILNLSFISIFDNGMKIEIKDIPRINKTIMLTPPSNCLFCRNEIYELMIDGVRCKIKPENGVAMYNHISVSVPDITKIFITQDNKVPGHRVVKLYSTLIIEKNRNEFLMFAANLGMNAIINYNEIYFDETYFIKFLGSPAYIVPSN